MVLLIENEPTDAEVIRRAIDRAWVGEDVTWLRSGEEAVAYFMGEGRYGDRAKSPLPGLVLLDLELPGMGGAGVLAWLRGETRFASLPVIVLTALAVRSEIDRAYRLGANSFVVKRKHINAFAADMRDVARFWLKVCALPGSAGGAVSGAAAEA